ncbi:MAG: ComF family protein [Pyrinomonadaceae bacterium]
MLSHVIDPLLSLVYPQECSVCHRSVDERKYGSACALCWNATRIFQGTELTCGKCGAYFDEKAAPVQTFCRKCDDYFFDKAIALGVYEKALAAAVIALKNSPHLPTRVTKLIQDRSFEFDGIDLIIPIPLSKARRIERGYNQAEVVAREIGAITGKPVDPHSLVRHLQTPIHRMGMDQRARELSVRNAFTVKRPRLIEDKSVLLVDDVLTSGATASFCAKTLKKNGARQVVAFTLARAVMR